MSKPTTFAPPSIIAFSTRPSSGVQVTLGLPSNGGVLKVSSSSASTTAGEDAGGCTSPKARQRSMVSKSIEKPRSPSSAGEAARRPAESAIRTPAAAARRRTGSMEAGGGTVLLEAQQAADDRRRAGLGLRVDPEHHFVAADARIIDCAPGQTYVDLGEIVEACGGDGVIDLELVAFAPAIDPLDEQGAVFGA